MCREEIYTEIGRGISHKKSSCKTDTNKSVILRWVMQSRLSEQVNESRTAWMAFTIAGFC